MPRSFDVSDLGDLAQAFWERAQWHEGIDTDFLEQLVIVISELEYRIEDLAEALEDPDDEDDDAFDTCTETMQ